MYCTLRVLCGAHLTLDNTARMYRYVVSYINIYLHYTLYLQIKTIATERKFLSPPLSLACQKVEPPNPTVPMGRTNERTNGRQKASKNVGGVGGVGGRGRKKGNRNKMKQNPFRPSVPTVHTRDVCAN